MYLFFFYSLPPQLALADLLFEVSRVGGLHTSGSSMEGALEVGYSSNGWETNDDVL